MFEKEAEENANQFIKTHSESDDFINCKRETDNYNVILAQGYEIGFQKGAEFGYNKANEWHFVKDGLPKDNEYVLIYTDLKNTYVARIPTKKDYFVTRRGGFVQMSAVIAWKEIVLPKEIKEK